MSDHQFADALAFANAAGMLLLSGVSAGGSYAAGIVSGSLTPIAAGTARTLVFRVSVN